MISCFNGRTADEVWLSIANEFRNGKFSAYIPSRGGHTRELLHAGLSISEPLQRWITSRFPPINPAFAIAEVIWIVMGRNDSKFLNYFNKQLPKYSGTGDKYHGAYGYRLRRHFEVDQLDKAYKVFKANPDSRQVVLQFWDVRADFPEIDGTPIAADIPCNIVSLVKVRDNTLDWTQIMRSNDFFIGLPYNVVQFTYLQEILAGWLGFEIGAYNHFSDSLHVYQSDEEKIYDSHQIPASTNTDTIGLPKADSESLFAELAQRVGRLIERDISIPELKLISNWTSAPMGYRNMLLLLCAEFARKSGWLIDAEELIRECSNHVLVEMWYRWYGRKKINQVY